MTYQDTLNSQYLSTSLSDLSHSRRKSSLIVRTYKQATNLYLTKRFHEAWETLEPIVSPQRSTTPGEDGEEATESAGAAAPVADSSKGTRVKVWVFYLSLLNAIVDLGQEEGKHTLGLAQWRRLAAKARDGTIWDEVVQRGYRGNEGQVDAEVVVNLSTLLLGHMQSQKLNQQRLELYLTMSDPAASGGHRFADGNDGATSMSSASSSPKALETRLRILELYTLHVLPANQEWEYAESVIELSDALDDERKDAFLHALQGLREESDGTAQRERELQEQREQEMLQLQKAEQAARRAEEKQKQEDMRRRSELNKQRSAPTRPKVQKPSTSLPAPPPKPSKEPRPPRRTFYRRASLVILNLHQIVLRAGREINITNKALLRFLVFVLALLLLTARRDLRVQLQRVLNGGWSKLKQTIAMGVKVSYI